MGRESGRHAHITHQIIAAGFEVHRALGPGLLERFYQECLADELRLRGLRVEREVAFPALYKGRRLDATYRLDLVIEGAVVVEIKAIERIQSVHVAQMLTYLRLSGLEVGLLLNFNVTALVDGIRRVSL